MKSKRVREMAKLYDPVKVYTLVEAIAILKAVPPVKFEQSVEIALMLGLDPRKSDQGVRGTVSLPNGTGKSISILVFTKGDKVDEALRAGADYAGHQELIDKVAAGWTRFDAVIATPDVMREVGKLGKVLGPRGLMPTPKTGRVTNDVASAVKELKAGKIEFKNDRHGVISVLVGKLNFSVEDLIQNIRSLIRSVQKAKPATAKGQYLKSLVLSSTMGPGLKIDLRDVETSSVKE